MLSWQPGLINYKFYYNYGFFFTCVTFSRCVLFMNLFCCWCLSLQDSEKAVSREEGEALAKELGCMFLECSAKTRENVEQCFEELALKVQFQKALIC